MIFALTLLLMAANFLPRENENGYNLEEYFSQLRTGPAFKPDEEYKYEGLRLGSFKNFPLWCPVGATRLANAGFYYANHQDEVICFCCHGRIKQWGPGDDPMVEHKKYFRNCDFAQGRHSDNVPLFGNTSARTKTRSRDYGRESSSLSSLPRDNTYKQNDNKESGQRVRMDKPYIRAVLEMGFPREIIETVLRKRYDETGKDFAGAGELAETVLLYQETHENQEQKKEASSSLTSQSHKSVHVEAKLAEACNGVNYESQLESNSTESNAVTGNVNKTENKTPEKNTIKPTKSTTHKNKELAKDKTKSKDPVKREAKKLTEEEKRKLREEIREMKEQLTCKFCCENPVSIVLLPCGHLVSCEYCSPALRSCPICRNTIKGTVRTSMAEE